MQQVTIREPGLHWLHVHRRPERAARRSAVPLFVGFGTRKVDAAARRPALVLDEWSQLGAVVACASEGWLDEAVRGFFANGGRRCLVMPLQSSQDMVRAFQSGGIAENVDDADLVCVPDAVNDALRGSMPLNELQAAVVDHCERMGDRMAILDAPIDAAEASSPASAEAAATELRGKLAKSRFAALYAPGISIETALSRSRAGAGPALVVPPCGHVAGIYARTDAHTGVHKAPANEIVEGALHVQHDFDAAAHGRLNDAGVNCIRSVPGRGIRVMGARTLSARADWIYVPVARLFIELTRRLKDSMRDLVFEPSAPDLWAQVRRRIAAHCRELMDAGALAGSSPADAFYVKCDAETNPPEARDAGRLVAHIGLAPSVPAEFVVVRITHDASGIAVTGT